MMLELMTVITTQTLVFFPLAFGISISYYLLRATDMTLDGSFVLGAVVFAKLTTLGFSPYFAGLIALLAGASAGLFTAIIQRNGRVDALLAGILATFILSSINLFILGKPNISLLSKVTLLSAAFAESEVYGWLLCCCYMLLICGAILLLLRSHFGLTLRAFGDNPNLLRRLGKNIELYRLAGFALTNLLAAASGCFTTQVVGYADISMGLGMTLTGIGAIIIGQQLLSQMNLVNNIRIGSEFISCLFGVIIYFLSLNVLLRIGIDPIYLKMMLGLLLIFFLRSAVKYNLTVTSP